MQNAGFVAAIIHSVDSDRLLQMHGATSKQRMIIMCVKQKHYHWLFICFVINKAVNRLSVNR